MYTVKFTNKFKKSYKVMIKRGKDFSLLNSVVNTLMSGNLLFKKIGISSYH